MHRKRCENTPDVTLVILLFLRLTVAEFGGMSVGTEDRPLDWASYPKLPGKSAITKSITKSTKVYIYIYQCRMQDFPAGDGGSRQSLILKRKPICKVLHKLHNKEDSRFYAELLLMSSRSTQMLSLMLSRSMLIIGTSFLTCEWHADDMQLLPGVVLFKIRKLKQVESQRNQTNH